MRPALGIRCYDGGKLPPVPEDIGSGKELSDNGIHFVGNLATRLQLRIEWDTANMKAANAPEANWLVRMDYREGFGICSPRHELPAPS